MEGGERMAFEFRRLENADYQAIGVEVKGSSDTNPGDLLSASLDSPSVSGYKPNYSQERIHVETDNFRGVINLMCPVFNRVLLRSQNDPYTKFLNIPKNVVNGLLNYSKCYHIESGEFINVADVSPDTTIEDVMFGPNYLLHLIDKVNFIDETTECLKQAIKACKIFSEEDKWEVNWRKGDDRLVDDWYIQGCAMTDEQKVTVLSYLFGNGYTRGAIAFNTTDTALKTAVLSHIVVLPKGMRPEVAGRKHPMTVVYEDVIKANQGVQTALSTQRAIVEIAAKLKALDGAVNRLLYKSDPTRANRKSIEESLKSKFGHIRGNMFAKRQDLTGRAAVIVDPDLPLDTIAVPNSMLKKLLQYHMIKYPENVKDTIMIREDSMPRMVAEHSDIPILMGRHPTLHHLSILGFNIKAWNGNAIKVPPLVCQGYNMDFDGDTGHTSIPMTSKAIEDVQRLMYSSQNLYTHKDGVCTIQPRQDMIYGLYMCTKEWNKTGIDRGSVKSLETVFEMVMNYKFKVYDTVTFKGEKIQAGVAAVKYCLPGVKKVGVITKKTIGSYIEDILDYKTETIIDSLHKLISLGFTCSKLYTPTINYDMFEPSKQENEEFLKELKEAKDLYDDGFMTQDSFELKFDACYDKMIKNIIANVKSKLDPDNGFMLMTDSGARGDTSNLQQIFGCKGRVVKSGGDSFNCVIERSYSEQLHPLEHSLTAYGGRQGLIDKTLTTSEPGYLGRIIAHVAQSLVITCEDCGTEEGIEIKKKDIIDALYSVDWEQLKAKFIAEVKRISTNPNLDIEQIITKYDAEYDNPYFKYEGVSKQAMLESLYGVNFKEVCQQFYDMTVGRYTTPSETNGVSMLLSSRNATDLAFSENRHTLKIRSPLTCDNPCCRKCYGISPGSHQPIAVHSAIGFIAAQSLSEPGTQMTMNSFHHGGVATKGGTMSSTFSRLQRYLECSPLNTDKIKSGWDVIAPRDGEISYVEGPDNVSVQIDGKFIKRFPKGVKLKEGVRKGDTLCSTKGDYSIAQYQDIMGTKAAQIKLLHTIYCLYKQTSAIKSIHIECVISSMTLVQILDTDSLELFRSQWYHMSQVAEALGKAVPVDGIKYGDTLYRTKLFGLSQVPQTDASPLTKIMLEDIGRGLARAVVLNLVDPLEDTLQRCMFGLIPKIGSYYSDFINQRRKE